MSEEAEIQQEVQDEPNFRVFPIFSRDTANTGVNQPPPKKRRIQRELHYCLSCFRTLSRGNFSTRLKHANSSIHKNDLNYNHTRQIVSYDHALAVAARKQRKLSAEKHTSAASNYTSDDDVTISVAENDEEHYVMDTVEPLQPDDAGNFETDILDGDIPNASETDDTALDSCRCSNTPSGLGRQSSSMASSSMPGVQNMLPFAELSQSLNKQSDNQQFDEIVAKLDVIMRKMSIAEEEQKLNPPSKTSQVLSELKSASSISDIDGSGFELLVGPTDGGLVRCKLCYDRLCEKHPNLASEDPFNENSSGIERSKGNTLASGLVLSKEKLEQLLAGQCQTWYTFKRSLIDHAGCSTKRNGGFSHYKSLLWRKRKDVLHERMREIISNQLSAALMIVKTKAAGWHYESMMSFLHSCGAEVGNLGHGRKQVNHMLLAFQVHIWIKTKALLTNRLPSTGLFPHFATASDKSTPSRTTNHAVMILVMYNGKKNCNSYQCSTCVSAVQNILLRYWRRNSCRTCIASCFGVV